MRAVVFVNGQVSDYDVLRRQVRAEDYLIGADGGALHALELGLRPDVVVGDLDSLPPAIVDDLAERGTLIERYPVAKDKTDLELAIERAIRDGADEVVLVSALGGRLDQTLSNLLILAQQRWPISIYLVEGDQVAQIIQGGESLCLDGPLGTTVSVLPLSPVVRGITYSGLKYPLENATLSMGSTRGVSNVLESRPACIEVSEGMLLVVQSKGEENFP